jgi:hypothetical protein
VVEAAARTARWQAGGGTALERASASRLNAPLRLASWSFLMLFVELALIRWTAANNVHLAYVTNFVLLASFLGIGLGFLRGRAEPDLARLAPVALALLVAFVLAFPVTLTTLEGSGQLRARWGIPPLPQWLSLPLIFLLAVAVMAGVGQAVARYFAELRPLDAYRLDIVGSLAGIAVFSLLSFLQLPPVAWGAIVGLGFVALLGRRAAWWHWLAAAAIVAMLAAESLSGSDLWSPYYKITAVRPASTRGVLVVWANNIPHQTAYPVSTLRQIERFYFFPYRHVNRRRLDRVLVVGAGTGNDVAVALAEGARHVDAVEIDPVLQQLGRKYHANHPYQSRRVSVHIDDGRAFLQRTSTRYDLIMFALPDSLTLLPGQSNLRLENYLFTAEAMRTVRAHLEPGGTFSMYNYYEPFLLDRYAATLRSVFGKPPCVELGDALARRRQAVLTIGRDGSVRNCATRWRPVAADSPTDDHPFPYLQSRSIPGLYLWTLGLIVAFSVLAVRTAGGPLRRMAPYLDLGFMGGAFLLLETKNVVQFALLFGTTWLVNSLVFAGVLLSVLAAVEVARRVRLPRAPILYAALLAALALAWAVPQAWLLGLSIPLRFLAAVAVAFTPIFLANLVFAARFRDVASSTSAFAANLLGAMLGGVLEYLALITGYRFLLIVVGALYALALVANRAAAPAPARS